MRSPPWMVGDLTSGEIDELDVGLLIGLVLQDRPAALTEDGAALEPAPLQGRNDRAARVVALDVAHRVSLPEPITPLGEDLDRGARPLGRPARGRRLAP